MAIKSDLNMIHVAMTDIDRVIELGWHCVVLEPHRAAHVWPEVHKWCVSEFGQHNYTHWGASFYFRNEKDAVLFALKYN